MKLVQLLAKELNEWPESATVIVQDENKNVWHLDKAHDLTYQDSEWTSKEWFDLVLVDGREILISSLASDNKTSKVTQEQWQAEREKMNKPKWIRHRGGKCPVADDVKVLYRMRSGTIASNGKHSCNLRWDHSKVGGDIMAYRVIEETKDQEVEEVKKTNFGTITYKLEIDATDANKEIDSLVAKWGQIESPLKWRDEIIELEAYEEEFRREREKLICKLESEGFKLIDHMAPVYGEQIIDKSDWRNIETGDYVTVASSLIKGVLSVDKEYRCTRDGDYIEVVSDKGPTIGLHARLFKLARRGQ